MNGTCFRHTWKIIDRQEQPSLLELLTMSGVTYIDRLETDAAIRSQIITFECDECKTQKVERV